MAETLGSLCDKLTIVKLKQFHSKDKPRLKSLKEQETRLQNEINEFTNKAAHRLIPLESLSFKANKVFKKDGNKIEKIKGNIGQVFAALAETNCDLWHVQEKIYEFEKVPARQKDQTIKQLALLNLKRNECIDEIDQTFIKMLK